MPIAWGVAPVDNLWAGIMDGNSERKWLCIGQLLFGADLLIWDMVPYSLAW
jgi:hypothetical protein